MLELVISPGEMWDEVNEVFVGFSDPVTLKLEHSLYSISKWESKYKKPFLSNKEKERDEVIYYIKCMTLNEVDDSVYNFLSQKDISKVTDYIQENMTATTFSEHTPKRPNKEIITAEIIYYWMLSYGIWIECEKWNLDKLLALIRVFQIKNAPSKKMSKRDIMSRNTALNAARRKKYGTKG